MTPVRSVGIVGLGLIGGSLARDLAARGVRVHAYDRDPATLRAALHAGVVAASLDASLENVADLDAVVLAVPVTAALDILERASARLARVPVVTDVCSTKQTIGHTAERVGLGKRFIGAHPLAGDHRSGWDASRIDLFRGATVYLCPGTDTAAGPVAALRELWQNLGAVPEIIDPAGHDRLLAWTSHLPQAAATALARALSATGIPPDSLGPGGRDMTRLAGSSPDVWTPIALDNSASLCGALNRLETELATLREALARADHDAVRRFFDLTGDPPRP
jgi:prephenate dehydrogenase